MKNNYRDNLAIRILTAPYKKYEYSKICKEYLNSEEPERLKNFNGCNEGKRCFLIGNGPSLRISDLNKIKNEISMAANHIYSIFNKTEWRPTYYFIADTRGIGDLLPYVEKMDLSFIFVPYKALKYEKSSHPEWYHIREKEKYKIFACNDKEVHISENITKYFCSGGTVLFTALQFAIYTGIKEIYLLGVDFNYSYILDKWGRKRHIDGVTDYFYKEKEQKSHLIYYTVLYAWQVARKYCDEHGIKIYNATRGGKLEVFERVDFDSLFKE